MPSGGGKTFKESSNSESITFTIDDDTKIKVEMLQGEQDGTIESITKDSVLEVTLKNNIAESIIVKNLNSAGGFGGSSEVTNGTSANTIDKESTITNKTYSSTGDDENALRVDGANVTLKDITVQKVVMVVNVL